MTERKGRRGTVAVVVGLLGLLGFSLYVMLSGWDVGEGGKGGSISTNGYVAMGLGIVFTLGLGVGLMALVFYSNRHHRD